MKDTEYTFKAALDLLIDGKPDEAWELARENNLIMPFWYKKEDWLYIARVFVVRRKEELAHPKHL